MVGVPIDGGAERSMTQSSTSIMDTFLEGSGLLAGVLSLNFFFPPSSAAKLQSKPAASSRDKMATFPKKRTWLHCNEDLSYRGTKSNDKKSG